jgi:hypothetical protein
MLGFNALASAVKSLASALNGLADTVNAANAALRGRLELDGPEGGDVPALPTPGDTSAELEAPRRNGRGRAAE